MRAYFFLLAGVIFAVLFAITAEPLFVPAMLTNIMVGLAWPMASDSAAEVDDDQDEDATDDTPAELTDEELHDKFVSRNSLPDYIRLS
jgi:hypothetical protein